MPNRQPLEWSSLEVFAQLVDLQNAVLTGHKPYDNGMMGRQWEWNNESHQHLLLKKLCPRILLFWINSAQKIITNPFTYTQIAPVNL